MPLRVCAYILFLFFYVWNKGNQSIPSQQTGIFLPASPVIHHSVHCAPHSWWLVCSIFNLYIIQTQSLKNIFIFNGKLTWKHLIWHQQSCDSKQQENKAEHLRTNNTENTGSITSGEWAWSSAKTTKVFQQEHKNRFYWIAAQTCFK